MPTRAIGSGVGVMVGVKVASGVGETAWGQCPAWGNGGKVREDGTGRYRSGKQKSKKDADVLHPVFILVKERSVKRRIIRILCDILKKKSSGR